MKLILGAGLCLLLQVVNSWKVLQRENNSLSMKRWWFIEKWWDFSHKGRDLHVSNLSSEFMCHASLNHSRWGLGGLSRLLAWKLDYTTRTQLDEWTRPWLMLGIKQKTETQPHPPQMKQEEAKGGTDGGITSSQRYPLRCALWLNLIRLYGHTHCSG